MTWLEERFGKGIPVPSYISLGAGVQSSTMALMAAHGEIMPMPKAAIFADTQAEPSSVYRWLDWLEKQLPFPVIRATYGNLATAPLRLHKSKKSGNIYSRALIPLFVKKIDGSKGIMPRRCTRDYKVNVVQRELKKLLGWRTACARVPISAFSWIGISRDEAHRMKPSLEPWIRNRWPLIEQAITRQGCLDWMQKHSYPKPPRSACVFCPYHSDREWLRLKTEEPEEFKKAVSWEEQYRKVTRKDETLQGAVPFLHDSLVPLSQVAFNPEDKKADQFGNECEGMCGV